MSKLPSKGELCSQQFGIQWKVANFETLPSSPGDTVFSPTFTDPLWQTRWFLVLYPGGVMPASATQQPLDSLSLFVHLDSPGPVQANYSISIRDALGKRCFEFKSNHTFNDLGVGQIRFLAHDTLLKQSNRLLPDGCLTLQCEITVLKLELEQQFPVTLGGYNLCAALKQAASYDVTIEIGEESIEAHQIVLETLSPVFAQLLLNTTKSTSNNKCHQKQKTHKKENKTRLIIDNMDSPTLKLLLNYAYGERVPLNNASFETIEKLTQAACTYKVEALLLLCIRLLASKLKPSTATRVLLLANKFNLEQLYPEVLKVIRQDSYAVMTSPDWIEALASQTEVIQNTLRQLKPDIDDKTDEESQTEKSRVITSSRTTITNTSTTTTSTFHPSMATYSRTNYKKIVVKSEPEESETVISRPKRSKRF